MITTQFNHLENCTDSFEKVRGISLTVPNQSLTIREILRRSGVIDSGLPVYYDDNPDHDNVDPTTVSGFDLSDVTAISQEIAQRRTMREAEAEAQREEAQRSAADELKAKADAQSKVRAKEKLDE